MSEKAKVRFLASINSRRNFVHYLVFKKNQSKDVFDQQKVKWIVYTLFLAILLYSVFQTPGEGKVPLPNIRISMNPDFIDVPPPRSSKVTNGNKARKLKPLPGLQLVARKLNPFPNGVTKISASLIDATSDGPVKAAVQQPVELGEHYLPKGTIFSGTAKTQNDRLMMTFDSFKIPNEDSNKVLAIALDAHNGGLGVKGSAFWSKASKMAAKIGLNFTSGLAEGLKEKESTQDGQIIDKTSLKNALLNGASTAAMEAARDPLQAAQSAPESVSLPKGKNFHIIIKEFK